MVTLSPTGICYLLDGLCLIGSSGNAETVLELVFDEFIGALRGIRG